MKTLKEVDIVTVGFGWSASIIAAEACKNGLKVVGLERGENRKTENFEMIHDEWRYAHMHGLMQDLSRETITMANKKEQKALPMRKMGAFVIGDGVGGCGTHWNGMHFRFDPYDFSIRTATKEKYGEARLRDKDGYLIRDWALSYDEIEPYYTRFEQLCGVSGDASKNPFGGKMSKPYPTKALPITPVIQRYIDAASSIGLHPYMLPASNCSEPWTNEYGLQINMCQFCGFCERFACEYGAKASPHTATIPYALSTGNLEIRTHSNVLEIVHKNGIATGVKYIDTLTLKEYFQPAKVVVLSSYVLSNVRLLLLSKIGKPYDPKTGEGVVGKNFCYQLNGGSSVTFDEEYNLFMGSGSLGANLDDYNADNFDHKNLDFLHGASIFMLQTGTRPISSASGGTTIGDVDGKSVKNWGLEHKRASAFEFTRKRSVSAQGASLPHKENFLTLDDTYKDAYGLPLLKMVYNYTNQDRNLMKFLVDKTYDIAKAMNPKYASKSGDIGNYNVMNYNTSHITGGAIMGENSKDSVVNNYLQSHDVKNLFVVGASSFLHNSGFNPTDTVGALSFRCAEGILKYFKGIAL